MNGLLSQGLITISHRVDGLALGSCKVCMWLNEQDTAFLISSQGVRWFSENQELIHAAVDRALSPHPGAAQEILGMHIDPDGQPTGEASVHVSKTYSSRMRTAADDYDIELVV